MVQAAVSAGCQAAEPAHRSHSRRDNPKDDTHAESPAPTVTTRRMTRMQSPPHPSPQPTASRRRPRQAKRNPLIAEQPERPRNQQRWRRQPVGKRRLPGLPAPLLIQLLSLPFPARLRMSPSPLRGHLPRPLAGERTPRASSHDNDAKSMTYSKAPATFTSRRGRAHRA